VPKHALVIKIRLPYLYFCLEIVTSLNMGAKANAFYQNFNGIENFVGGKGFFKLKA
jgi:hypothetical protein